MIRTQTVILILAALLAGCGTLDKRTNRLRVGDDTRAVLRVMGNPAKRQSKGDQEVWQYCKSGSSFGSNDHKDIMFTQGKVVAIDSYASHITGCTNGIHQAIVWRTESLSQEKQPPSEKFSIEKAKATCKEFGFKVGTDGMANCLLTQQIRHDSTVTAEQSSANETKRMSQQEDMEAQRMNQQQENTQNQQQAQMLQGIQKSGEEMRRQQAELFKPKPVTTTDCRNDGFGNVHCTTR